MFSKRLKLNKNARIVPEIFGIDKKRAYEIHDFVFSIINSQSKSVIDVLKLIFILNDKYKGNEMYYVLYFLGFTLPSIIENPIIFESDQIKDLQDFIKNKYFEMDCKVH